jgi:hypothetical protein
VQGFATGERSQQTSDIFEGAEQIQQLVIDPGDHRVRFE